MSKQVVRCVWTILGNNNFLVKFEYGQNMEISASSMPYICSKQEVFKQVDKTISELPKIVQGELLSIDGGPVYE